jgi:hypothetical protein
MVLQILDETMGEPIGYGSNAFVPSINPIKTKE